MIRHVFLALFLLALALPAVALPVPAAAPTTEVQDCHGMPLPDHHDKKDGFELRLHGCIGCIAPLATALHALPIALRPFIPHAPLAPPMDGASPRPSLPPPRG
jgi:hypothetical protein